MKSDLYAGVLVRAAEAGLYRTPPRGREALLAAARKGGLAAVSIDLAAARDKTTLLAAVARALQFPEWFGGNWDALDDCLGDLSWLPARGYLVLLEHGDGLRRADPASYSAALAIFAEASRAWREQGTAFWVFADAPAADLPDFPPGRR